MNPPNDAGGLSGSEMLDLREQVSNLRRDFDLHASEERDCLHQMMFTQTENTAAILRTHQMISEQKSDTREMIQLFKDGQAVIRIGTKLGRFIRWVIGLSAVGIVAKWFTTNF